VFFGKKKKDVKPEDVFDIHHYNQNNGVPLEEEEDEILYKEYPLRYIKFTQDGYSIEMMALYEAEGKAQFFVTCFDDGDNEEFASMIQFTDDKEGTVITSYEIGDDEESVERIVIPRDLLLNSMKQISTP